MNVSYVENSLTNRDHQLCVDAGSKHLFPSSAIEVVSNIGSPGDVVANTWDPVSSTSRAYFMVMEHCTPFSRMQIL